MQTRQEEYQQKHQILAKYMEDHQLDAVVLTRRCNFAWYTCGGLNHVATCVDVGASSLLITPERAVCITNVIEAPRVGTEELAELGIEVKSFAWHDADEAGRVWSEAIGHARTAFDVKVPGLPDSATPLNPGFDRLRWTLTEGEINRYRSLGQEVADCLETAGKQARPGMSEYELAARIAGLAWERGIRCPVLLVAADDRVKNYRHPLPTDKKFEDYGMAVCCGERHGLFVSNTRLFSFKPIDEDLKHRHQAVCAVDAAIIAATRPGNTLGDVMTIAERTYAQGGYPNEWQLHHQGGSTGYLSREVKATPGNATLILKNQAFAWNPSIAGTKSEDTVLVTENGHEILSQTGNWPTTNYEAEGQNWPRCDILEL